MLKKFVSDFRQVGAWFSPGTSVSSTNKSDRHGIAEIVLKVALNTIVLIPYSLDRFHNISCILATIYNEGTKQPFGSMGKNYYKNKSLTCRLKTIIMINDI